jgi:deoxyadenosine/deoxycytidine kinase
VERWQDVAGPSGRLNLLKTFYDDPKRYAYPFQNYVFLTRVMAVSLFCCHQLLQRCQKFRLSRSRSIQPSLQAAVDKQA